MRAFSISPMEALRSMWCNGGLLVTLTKREVVGRYRGSVMGILWSFLNPLFMLLVYTFVFSVVFQARWGTGVESKADFAIYLFVGLIVFNLFAECVSRSPTLITQNVNYVKKVVFPIEILPCVSLGSALFHGAVSLGVWTVFYWYWKGCPQVTAILVPLVVLPFIIFTLGLSWLLASLGVFLRDISQIISLALSVLMFLSPVFYPTTALPLPLQNLMRLNPLANTIEALRALLLFGTLPETTSYLVHLTVACIFASLSFAWFQKTRRAFADVL
jgi:lipopolysaccharide transport system permease protein